MNHTEIRIRPSINVIRNVLVVIDDLIHYLDHPETTNNHIHDVRLDIKKLRAWIRLVQGPVVKYEWQEIDHHLRDMAKQLSDRRDVEIIPQTFVWLEKKENGKHVVLSIQKVHTKIRKKYKHNVHFANLHAATPTDRKTLDTLKRKTLSETRYETIRQGLRKTYKHTRKFGGVACSDSGTIEDLHKFRRWVKYLYYQLEFVRDVYIDDTGKLYARLGKLGKRLGRIHDLVLIKAYMEDLVENKKPGKDIRETGKVADRRIRKLVKKVQKSFSGIFALKPDKFVAGLKPF